MQNTDTLSKYGQSFQTKVLSCLIADVRLLDTLREVIHPKFFESEANKWVVEEIMEYYDEFKRTPSLDVFKVEISKMEDSGMQKRIIEQLKLAFTQLGDNDLDYVKKEFSNFCINQNLKEAIVQSVDLLKAGSYDRIKDLVDKAMKVGVDTDLGLEYVLDFEERSQELNRTTVPTDWSCINELMDGGLGPGELGVVVAPSGVGKTWVLCALGAAAVKAGMNVVHYSLELSEHYVGQRYDTVFTQISSADLKDRKEDVLQKIKKLKGRLLIKYFPPKGISARNIESHIEKMTAAGNKPDLVIIDYADLLLSTTNKSDSTYGE
jgi:replicative DNA helicase